MNPVEEVYVLHFSTGISIYMYPGSQQSLDS